MNPSTQDIIDAVLKTPSEYVFVLPNNKNICMVARQASEIITERKVVVIPTETVPQGMSAMIAFNPDADVVSGPYHPSIGELVQSKIYFTKIIKELKSDAEILVNGKDISAFVGNKKTNIKKLKEAGFDVSFKADASITPGEFKILRKEQR